METAGVAIRVSASQSVELGFISLVESYQKTLNNGIQAFLLGTQHKRYYIKRRPARWSSGTYQVVVKSWSQGVAV